MLQWLHNLNRYNIIVCIHSYCPVWTTQCRPSTIYATNVVWQDLCEELQIEFTVSNQPVLGAGKAGSHEPPLFTLPCHILVFSLPAAMSHHYFPFRTTTFDSSGQTTFLNGIFRAFKVWFLKIQPRHAINIYLDLYISVLIQWNP